MHRLHLTEVLKSFLRVCLVVYFDNILILSQSKEDHFKDIKSVLEALKENQLTLNLNKCEFFLTELCFLRFIIRIRA